LGLGDPSPEDIRAALERVLASRTFAGARRSRDLLRFLVEAVLGERTSQIKEYTIGAEALGRGAGFDPRFDSIARVEASRLRSRLALYQATEGQSDEILITLPSGGYVPEFTRAGPTAAPSPGEEPQSSPDRWGRQALIVVGALAALVIGGLSLMLLARSTPTTPPAPPLQLEARLGADGELWTNPGVNMALSRDGRMLVMSIRRADGSVRLYTRPMNALVATELPGTEDASSPCLSPDGRWVAFFSGGQLRKTLVGGEGSPMALAPGALAFACSWEDDGHVIATLSNDGAIWRVPVNGAAPSRLVDLGSSAPQPRWPSVLPDKKGVLFVATLDGFTGSIEVVGPDGKGRKSLGLRGNNPHYLPSGHILYNDGPQLLAVRFDLDRLETIGPPKKVVEDIAYQEFFGIAPFTASDNGTLLYLPGGANALSTVQLVDASGKMHPLVSQPARRFFLRVAPDGQHLVYVQADGSDNDIWLYDMERKVASRLTTEPHGGSGPGWSGDGKYVFYTQAATRSLAARRIDGSGDPQILLNLPGNFWASPLNTQWLVFQLSHENNQLDLFTASVSQAGERLKVDGPSLFYSSPASETQPTFSPDGRWVAYSSNEGGQADVFVRPFPSGGKATKISSSPGSVARWSRDGSSIVYESRDRRLWRVPVHIRTGAFSTDPPIALPHIPLADTNVGPNFDLMPDGKSMVVLAPTVDEKYLIKDHIVVVRNLFDLLPE
jgi:serine/threonine-protein kinase